MENFSCFVGSYPKSITLRFALIPQGMTLEYIMKYGLLANDKKRANDYKELKVVIDAYHKYIISEALSKVNMSWVELSDSLAQYRKDKTEENVKKEYEKMQKNYRSMVCSYFSQGEEFKDLFKKELFTKLLPNWIKETGRDIIELEKVETFKKFSTYFTGFHENRKNIYSKEDISTSVGYRVIHENFPKFNDNIKAFKTIIEHCPNIINEVSEELKSILKDKTVDSFFELDSYNHFLTQKGIECYNIVLNGYTTENGEKKKGLKELVNLAGQAKQIEKGIQKKCAFSSLYKQILSDRDSYSYIPISLQSDNEMVESVNLFYNDGIISYGECDSKINILERQNSLLQQLGDYDLEGIYVDSKQITNISQGLFSSWSVLNDCLFKYLESLFGTCEKIKNQKKIDTWLKREFISVDDLNKAIIFAGLEADVITYFKENSFKLLSNIYDNFKNVEKVLHVEYSFENPFKEKKENVATLKDFLDSIQQYYHLCRILQVSEDYDKDNAFYENFNANNKLLSLIIPLYNKVRNYLTQKNINQEIFKLNFENPTLANGWDQNKESDNSCIILIKDGMYYLGIMNAKNKPKLEKELVERADGCYQKMVYKLLPGPNKMLPKVFFSAKGLEEYHPSEYILNGYKKELHKKESNNIQFCHDLIDFFKENLNKHPDWSKFNFKFSSTQSYADISEFYKEVAEQGYKVTFDNIPTLTIDQWVSEGKLFLFQVYNKDFSPNATGRPNLHTIYWREAFSAKNLKDVVIKLNGEAELFYRKASIKKPFVHRKGEIVVGKRTLNGNVIPDKYYKQLLDYKNNKIKKEDLELEAVNYLDKLNIKELSHDIIKDRRYSQNQFSFHVPLTLNFKASGTGSDINKRMNEYVDSNKTGYIIGLDRGERNLIYLTMIDRDGNIVLQKSLNEVQDPMQRSYNYQEKLGQREKERDEARKSWDSIGTIKELKEGYLSVVIPEITQLAVKHNAIIVMEDLNFGFKRGRFKIEKQIYQKFEKRLIDKLNYLVVDKCMEVDKPGGALKGYQLTSSFNSFKKLGKQSGLLYYVPAAYTSKIDPTTGFVNLFDLKLNTKAEINSFFRKFKSIRYDVNEGCFVFKFKYSDYKTYQKDFVNDWEVYSHGKRIVHILNSNGYRSSEEVDLTKEIKELFGKYQINYLTNSSLNEAICSVDKDDFLKSLLRLFRLILQMRNSDENNDYIISPVKNRMGKFYCSNENDNGKLPCDADANGAYHIALKGLYLVKQGLFKNELKIETPKWFEFVQQRNL